MQIAEGNESAFSDFFYFLVPRLKPAIGKFTRGEDEMEDILQETFIKLWLSRDMLPNIDNIQGYAYKIALNTLRMRIRHEMLHRRHREQWERDVFNATEPGYIGQQGLSEMQEIINRAISALSGQRKKIYQLSREQGLTIPQIAIALNLSQNTVKNTLIAALASIREQLILAGYHFTIACLWLLF